MRTFINLVILALLGCMVEADFTCFTDESGSTEACAVNQCFVIYKKAHETRQYGCLLKMKTEQRNYCAKNAALCKTCKTKNCNTKDLLKVCISCRTKGTGADDRCTTDPGQLKKTHVTSCRSGCITFSRDDGSNIRGCSSPSDDCDFGNCDECTDNLCNDQIYPKTRRICRTNEGTEVCLNKDDKCLNVLGADGKPVQAGCNEHLHKNNPKLQTMCEKFPTRCALCSENECNEDVKYQKCLRCDQDDEGCLDAPESVNPKNMEYCRGKCFLEVDDDAVERGCYDEHGCEEGLCVQCDGPFCKESPKRQLCFIDKENADKCIDPKDKCVSVYDHGTGAPIKQSCLKELNEAEQKICTDEPARCEICEDSKCNEWKEKLRCITCTGPDCLKADETQTKLCDNGKCYTKILPDGANERGCVSEEVECKNPECEICAQDVCNKGILPRDRRFCRDGKGDTQYCLNANDECYIAVATDGEILRGCLEEATVPCESGKCRRCTSDDCNSQNICLNCKDTKSCANPEYCFATDAGCYSLVLDGEIEKGCNSKGLCEGQTYCYECTGDNCNTKEPTVDGTRCHKCRGEEHCIGEQTGEPTACNLRDDECYVLTDGVRAQRGCASNIACDGVNCQICDGDGCNSYALEKQTCYQCDHNDEGCGPELDQQLIEPTECSFYNLPDQLSSCFTNLTERKRGCLPFVEYRACQNFEGCSSCTEPACNNNTIHTAIANSINLHSTYTTWLFAIFTTTVTMIFSSS